MKGCEKNPGVSCGLQQQAPSKRAELLCAIDHDHVVRPNGIWQLVPGRTPRPAAARFDPHEYWLAGKMCSQLLQKSGFTATLGPDDRGVSSELLKLQAKVRRATSVVPIGDVFDTVAGKWIVRRPTGGIESDRTPPPGSRDGCPTNLPRESNSPLWGTRLACWVGGRTNRKRRRAGQAQRPRSPCGNDRDS